MYLNLFSGLKMKNKSKKIIAKMNKETDRAIAHVEFLNKAYEKMIKKSKERKAL